MSLASVEQSNLGRITLMRILRGAGSRPETTQDLLEGAASLARAGWSGKFGNERTFSTSRRILRTEKELGSNTLMALDILGNGEDERLEILQGFHTSGDESERAGDIPVTIVTTATRPPGTTTWQNVTTKAYVREELSIDPDTGAVTPKANL